VGLGAAGTAAAIGAAGSVVGTAGSLVSGSKSSSGSSQSAAMSALEFNQNTSNTADYIAQGQTALNTLAGNIESGQLGAAYDTSTMPQFNWNPTEAGLEQTPGYQFTLQQGLKSTQNAAAAQGLGVSGAALKGAASYATGLADSTYGSQLTNAINTYNTQLNGWQQGFTDYWSNQTNRYNQLYNIASLGANSAAGQGTSNTQGAANTGNALQTAGQASAAGTQGAANTLSNALNTPSTQNLLTNLFSGGGSTINPASGSSDASIYNNAFAGNTL
jgi:hypothetical protein